MSEVNNTPLLSIIIPCYNHGQYLGDAIKSCLSLRHPNIEIIVVDDGSTDNTQAVAHSFQGVRYIYHQNSGLPFSRNRGIDNASGEYVTFLDADDWYLPEGLITNLKLLQANPSAAFISGCHLIQFENGTYLSHCYFYKDDFYIHLLHNNFIGNPSTVIYRRETLEKYKFSTLPGFKGCEDYEHYLRITRDNPIIHNPVNISVYRKHEANMSNNFALMLNSALNVLSQQKPLLRTEEERKAWEEGWEKWVEFYGYFPIRTNIGRKLTKVHLELVRKYHIRFPLIVWKKILSIIKKKEPDAGTTTADIY